MLRQKIPSFSSIDSRTESHRLFVGHVLDSSIVLIVRCILVANRDAEPVGVASLVEAFHRRDIHLQVVSPSGVEVHLEPSKGATVVPRLSPGTVVIHRNVMQSIPLLTLAFDCWSDCGVDILNDFRRSTLSRNKFEAAVALDRAGIPVVDAVAFTPPHFGPMPKSDRLVVKPACGARGIGVERVQSLEDWLEPVDLMPQSYRPFWIAQPEVLNADQDWRAFVIDGKCVAIMRRRAVRGEWRANAFLGAECTPDDPKNKFGLAAEKAVLSLGLDYASVDIFNTDSGPVINEVDPWGGFAAISRTTGIDVADRIADLVALRAVGSGL